MDAYEAAVLTGDLEGLRGAVTDDVALHSPITQRIPFEGKERVLELYEDIFDLLGPTEVVRRAEGSGRTFLEIKSELAGYPSHLIQMLEVEPDGRVKDITLFMRPMPAAVNLYGHLGPRLVRRRFGRVAGALVALFTKPIVFAVKLGDRISPRLV